MFDAKDAKQDWDHDGLTNYDEIMVYNTSINNSDSNGDGIGDGKAVWLGLNPLKNYPNDFISLIKKLPESVQKEYCDKFVRHNELTKSGEYQTKFLLSLSKEEFQKAVKNGLISNKDWDGDYKSNYFEKFIAHLNPYVPNRTYVILEDGWNNEAKIPWIFVNDEFENSFNLPRENVYKLHGWDATWENFKKVVDDIAKKSTKNDIVVIGMYGHGDASGKFAFNNGSAKEPHVWINDDDIEKILRKINSKEIWITINACYAQYSIDHLKDANKRLCIATTFYPASLLDLMRNGSLYRERYGIQNYDLNGDDYISLREAVETDYETLRMFGHQDWIDKYYKLYEKPKGLADTFFVGDIHYDK